MCDGKMIGDELLLSTLLYGVYVFVVTIVLTVPSLDHSNTVTMSEGD